MSTKQKVLVKLQKANVRLNNFLVLKDIDFTLRQGESWAVLGKNGAGKSTLLKLLRGDLWPIQNSKYSRLYFAEDRPLTSPLAFKRNTALVSPDLMQTYLKHKIKIKCREVILSGRHDSLRLFEDPGPKALSLLETYSEKLNLNDLILRPFLDLSQGQRQKVLLARALVSDPKVLFLDEIFDNLELEARSEIRQALKVLLQESRQIVFTSHDPEDLLPAMHSAVLMEQGKIEKIMPAQSISSFPTSSGLGPSLENTSIKQSSAGSSTKNHLTLHLQKTKVWIEGEEILNIEDLKMPEQESWLVTGPNGAGKSTLLKLILGEIHPLPEGRVLRFGQLRQKDLWELKRKIGYFSPDLQTEFQTSGQTAKEVLFTGFSAAQRLMCLPKKKEQALALSLAEEFHLDSLLDQKFSRLSNGQQKAVLLLRTILNKPQLILLDEPFAGLDSKTSETFKNYFAGLIFEKTQLIIAAHSLKDTIFGISRHLALEQGRILKIESL